MVTETLSPPQVVHLFPEIDDLLMELLASLTQEDWHKPTALPPKQQVTTSLLRAMQR